MNCVPGCPLHVSSLTKKHLDGFLVRHHYVVQCICAQQGLSVVHRETSSIMQQRHRLGLSTLHAQQHVASRARDDSSPAWSGCTWVTTGGVKAVAVCIAG